MDSDSFDSVLTAIDRLETSGAELHPRDAELEFLSAITPLLQRERYVVGSTSASRDVGIGFVAERSATAGEAAVRLGIEYKHSKRGVVRPEVVLETSRAALSDEFNRILLVTNGRYSQSSLAPVFPEAPVSVELLTLADLREWYTRLKSAASDGRRAVQNAVRDLGRVLADAVAKDQSALDEIEWRDLERLLAEVFERIGFDVTLTRPSKDGGKDLILSCSVSGRSESYLVEIKHWRSGKRVGEDVVRSFVQVVAEERRSGGLVLSSSGYVPGAFTVLSAIERRRVRLGSKEKVVSLCRAYQRIGAGLWSAPANLATVLYEGTV